MTIGLNCEGRRIGELHVRRLPEPGKLVKTADGELFLIDTVRTAGVGDGKASVSVRPYQSN